MGLSDCRVQTMLAVSDLDRAKRFYERQLGLVPGEQEEEIVGYPCADGTEIAVYLSSENAGESRATLAGWFVDDLDQTMAELASRGVVFEQYDQPGLKTSERGRRPCNFCVGNASRPSDDHAPHVRSGRGGGARRRAI